MNDIEKLLEQNRAWSEAVNQRAPDFFARLSRQQNPDYLWIGCSDSRVPANQIIDLPPRMFCYIFLTNRPYNQIRGKGLGWLYTVSRRHPDVGSVDGEPQI